MKLVIATLLGLVSFSEAIALKDHDNKYYPYYGHQFKEPVESWKRSTTDMVDDNAKVSNIGRKMDNNPKRSRKEWKETRAASVKTSVEQDAQEQAWLKENSANVEKYKTKTAERIKENLDLRDKGMKAYYVSPPAYDSQADKSPGFEHTVESASTGEEAANAKEGEAAAPEAGSALQLQADDITFMASLIHSKNIDQAQQKIEQDWINQQNAALAKHFNEKPKLKLHSAIQLDDLTYIQLSEEPAKKEEKKDEKKKDEKKAAAGEEKKESGEEKKEEKKAEKKEAKGKKEEKKENKKEEKKAKEEEKAGEEEAGSDAKEQAANEAAGKDEAAMAKEAKQKLQDSIQNAKDGVPMIDPKKEESKTTGEWRRHATTVVHKQLDAMNKNESAHSDKMGKASKAATSQKKKVWDGLNVNKRHNW